MSPQDRLFKILPAALWSEAERLGRMPWAAIDRVDGFVHLSAEDQVRETAEKHFATQPDLVLIELNPAKLTDLRWESSRGGALFPHVYADVPLEAVVAARTLVGARPGEFRWSEALG